MKKLRRRLSEACEMPEASFGPCPYLAIESNSSIRIDECLEILSYDESLISLRLRGMTVTVAGEGMTMRSYAMKTVRIGGVIRSVALEEETGRKRT